MSPEEEMADFLRLSTAAIDQAPEAETRRRYAQFMEACQARTERQALDQQTDMDAYVEARDKDLADYGRARQAEASGDLHTAAEWYAKAADNDFADSALRLAQVLERIADRYVSMPGSRAAAGELRIVVEEASQWYITAHRVGDIDVNDLATRLDRLLNHLDRPSVPSCPVLTIAASTDEPKPDRPRPRPEPLAPAGNELRSQQTGQRAPAPDQPSTR